MMAVVDQHSLGGYMMAVVVVEPSLSLPVLSSVKAYLFQLFLHFSLKSIVPRSFFFKMCLHPEKILQNVSEFFADLVPKILAYYPNILQRATGFYF